MEIESEKQDNQTKLKDNKKARVIVRNLVYDISEKHIRQFFKNYGNIQDVSLPINPSTNKAKGFAFIQFENPNLAKKAINELNGQLFKGRKIFLDLSVAKEKYEKLKQDKSKFQENDKQDSDQNLDLNESDNQEEKKQNSQQQQDNEDSISIDNNWMKNKQQIQIQDKNQTQKNIEKQQKKAQINIQNDIDADCEDEEDEEQLQNKQQQNQVKQTLKPATKQDLNTTIFVRNISFDVSEEEFKEFFEQFGKIHYAKLVMNQETHDNKGTGFVKYYDQEIANKLINDYSNKQNQSKTKKPINNLEKILNEGIDDINLELHGRRLIILPAINRNDAQKIQEQDQSNQTANRIQDIRKIKSLDKLIQFDRLGKRNLSLAKIGLFEIENFMDEKEQERRALHLQEKLEKLKNPNMIVSKTRVLLKNLPKINFDETDIKNFALKSIQTKFESQDIKNKKLIKRIKLLRDKEKVDQNGLAKSKGIALIEFTQHEYALCFLQYCCQQKKNILKQFKKLPIFEFSIEDVRKIKQREKQLALKKQDQQKNSSIILSKEDKLKQKQIKHQDIVSNKLLIKQILEKDNISDEDKLNIKKLLQKIKSRGIKQRMKKLIEKKFGPDQAQQNENQEENKLKKIQKEVKSIIKNHEFNNKQQNNNNKDQFQKIKIQQQKEKQQLDEIKLNIKRKRQMKLQQEDHDELDDIVNKHLTKVHKKAKWSNE